jgi:hypothetical protein
MCGRFTQHYTWSEVHAFLSLLGAPQNLRPHYKGSSLLSIQAGSPTSRLFAWESRAFGAADPARARRCRLPVAKDAPIRAKTYFRPPDLRGSVLARGDREIIR